MGGGLRLSSMRSLSIAFAGLVSLGSGLAHAQAEPTDQPPPPPPQPSQEMVQAQPQAQKAPAAAGGQWVRTEQYGWVWMPYGQQYTYEPSDESATPYEYVYRPSY